jgi:hypothetical protein
MNRPKFAYKSTFDPVGTPVPGLQQRREPIAAQRDPFFRPHHPVPSARRQDVRHVGRVLGVAAQPSGERGMAGQKLLWFAAST